ARPANSPPPRTEITMHGMTLRPGSVPRLRRATPAAAGRVFRCATTLLRRGNPLRVVAAAAAVTVTAMTTATPASAQERLAVPASDVAVAFVDVNVIP